MGYIKVFEWRIWQQSSDHNSSTFSSNIQAKNKETKAPHVLAQKRSYEYNIKDENVGFHEVVLNTQLSWCLNFDDYKIHVGFRKFQIFIKTSHLRVNFMIHSSFLKKQVFGNKKSH